jgi:signal transduction histidine kinase
LKPENSDVIKLVRGLVSTEKMEEVKKTVSFLSHELKRPLASAVLSLHTVKDGYLGDLNASQKETLDAVAADLDRMTAVITELLDDPRRSAENDE